MKRLYQEYIDLKILNEQIDEFKKSRYQQVLDLIKRRKKSIKTKKGNLDKKSAAFLKLVKREEQIKQTEQTIKSKFEAYKKEMYSDPVAKFRSLTTSLKYYEILNNIELVIHVQADDAVLDDILENIYSLKAIGRSEDFVEVREAKNVELVENEDCELISPYSAYLDFRDIKEEKIYIYGNEENNVAGGNTLQH